jgi:hypothetical protein
VSGKFAFARKKERKKEKGHPYVPIFIHYKLIGDARNQI